MCCRLQGYIPSPLISYSVRHHRHLWRALVTLIGLALNRLRYPVLMGHSVHIGRNTTDRHTPSSIQDHVHRCHQPSGPTHHASGEHENSPG